jgi:hypothetical protein
LQYTSRVDFSLRWPLYSQSHTQRALDIKKLSKQS